MVAHLKNWDNVDQMIQSNRYTGQSLKDFGTDWVLDFRAAFCAHSFCDRSKLYLFQTVMQQRGNHVT